MDHFEVIGDSLSMPVQPVRVGFECLAEVFDSLVGKGMTVFDSSLPMDCLKMTSNASLRQKRTAKDKGLVADD